MFNAKELSPEQIEQIKEWANEGAQLDDIQKKLKEAEDINLTYMETRFLVLDLEITLQSEEEEVEEAPEEEATPVEAVAQLQDDAPLPNSPPPTASQTAPVPHAEVTSGVELHVDQIAIPNSMVSGSVTFSDGEKASWYIDTEGRLGMETESDTYTPSEAELSSFQSALRQQLEQM